MKTALRVTFAAVLAAAGPAVGALPAHASTGNPVPHLQPAACATAAAGHAHCNAIQLVPAGTASPAGAGNPAGAAPSASPAAISGYGPTDIQSAYRLGSNPGSGQVVAIVDAYDDPRAESDLATYRSQFGLTACTTANGCFRKVNQTGGTSYPTGDTGWGAEITLDVDAVSAACPGCHILLVEATSNQDSDLAAAVDEAVALGAKFVSNSYSEPESEVGTSLDTHYRHPGVMIAAATGDNGSMSGTNTQYPASSPTVVAIGGTSLSRASNTRGWTETVWGSAASGAQGTGSGCSGTFAKPSYQSGVTTNCARRATSDVSAVANPNTGLAIYDTYGQSGWLQYGGTSLATPIISSIWALAGAPAAGDNAVAYPYAHAANLYDVTSGSNGTCGAPICTAGTGWDGPTGLGTPNGTAAFVAGGTNPPPTNDFSVSLSPSSATVAAGAAATTTVSTAVTSGSAVSVSLSASGLPAGATASFNPTSVTAGGSSTLTVSTTASVVGGTYPLTVTGSAAGGASHSATFTLTVTGGGGGGGGVVTVTNPGTQVGLAGYFGATVQLRATDSRGLPLTFGATGLPAGTSLSASGYLSGTPRTAGNYSVRVTATDSGGGSGSAVFTYQVLGF